MLKDSLLWTKIGRIVARLSERLNIPSDQAFDLFYTSDTCRRLHLQETGLYLYGDLYIVDEVIREIQQGYHREQEHSMAEAM